MKSEHIRQEVETFPSVFLATNNQNMSTEMFVAKIYSDDWFKKMVKQHCVQGRDGKFPGKYAKMKHHRNLL